MTMNIYFDGTLIVSRQGGERATSHHIGTEAAKAIDDAIALGYCVEWQGLLYGDTDAPMASAEVFNGDEVPAERAGSADMGVVT